MEFKPKQKNKRNNKNKRPENHNRELSTISNIPVEKIKTETLSISKYELERCYHYRNGFCIIRDDKCVPFSLKCIKNKKSFSNSFAPTGSWQTESKRKVYRNSKEYNPYEAERYGSNQNIKTLNYNGDSVELHVFKGFLNLKKENTTDYYLSITDIRTDKQCKILVAYNSKTDRYYISETQLKWLHKRNIYPSAVFYASNDGSVPLVTINFQEFSRLALYGYSAGKNGMKSQDRRKLLKHIIDNGMMTGYEIVEHLQGLISLREGRTDKDFSIAINNWREDIKFVNDYKASKNR